MIAKCLNCHTEFTKENIRHSATKRRGKIRCPHCNKVHKWTPTTQLLFGLNIIIPSIITCILIFPLLLNMKQRGLVGLPIIGIFLAFLGVATIIYPYYAKFYLFDEDEFYK